MGAKRELARRFVFAGKEQDVHTGLIDFGARSYDARQGQWLSPDPAFDGLNLYAYVHNNPVNMVDPLGLSAEADEWTQHDYSDEISELNGESADLGVHWRGKGTDVWQAEQDAGDARAAAYAKSAANEGWHQLRNEPINVVDTSATWEAGMAIAMMFAPTGGAIEALGMLVATRTAAAAARAASHSRWVQALGRGSTASIAKGTTLARNVREQLAIRQAMRNPTAGRRLDVRMTDPCWTAQEGWVKMQQLVNSGGREGSINVHYVYNTVTQAVDDFKIVLQGAR